MIVNRLFWCNKPLTVLVVTFLYSCSSKKSDDIHLDSAAVIEKGIDQVFKKASFAPEFYSGSIRIIKSANVPANLNLFFNGKHCELIDEKSSEAYIGDLLHPIPYVAVSKISRNEKGIIVLDLKFPSVGTTFHLKIEEKEGNMLHVIAMDDSQE